MDNTMTIKDAIHQLQFDMEMITFDPSTGEVLSPETVKLRNKDNYNTYLADQMAIEALGKQVAKKPNRSGDGYADGHLVYDTWQCPNCEKEYELEYEEYDHCPNCGQKIDWEIDPEEEETDDR